MECSEEECEKGMRKGCGLKTGMVGIFGSVMARALWASLAGRLSVVAVWGWKEFMRFRLII
jgi:hypothetical protein